MTDEPAGPELCGTIPTW